MKMTNELLMDYLDGTLDATRQSAVEAHLQSNAEDAALVAEMRLAQTVLQDWNAAEPLRASDDFWIKVRNQLPDKPGRVTIGSRVLNWLWPQQASGFALPARVAALALFVAMAVSLFAPQDAQRPATAALSTSDRAFITQSLNRHTAYVATQPLEGFDTNLSDGRNGDGDGDDESNDNYSP